MEKWRYTVLGLAAVLIATGILLMLDAQVLGDRTTGIATIIGLTGMFLFVIFNKDTLLKKKRVK